jgi:hypothetical protein
MNETHILIRLLWMYISQNWEFGSALAKLRNFGGGFEPPKVPLRYANGGKSQLWWIVSWSDHLIQLSGQEDFVEICHESYKTHVIPWLAWSLLSSDLNPQFCWCCTLCMTVVSHWLWAVIRYLSDNEHNIQYISSVDVSVLIKYSCLHVHG